MCAALTKVRQEAAPVEEEEPPVPLAELCGQAASTLANAAQDGRLEAALREQCAKHEQQEAQPTHDLDVLRENTRNLLLRTEMDGRLVTALQNMPKSKKKADGE